jgi:hypothetical protein
MYWCFVLDIDVNIRPMLLNDTVPMKGSRMIAAVLASQGRPFRHPVEVLDGDRRLK